MKLTREQYRASIVIGAWMIKVLRMPKEEVKRELADLLNKYSATKLMWVSAQTNCTSLANLKAILKSKERNA